MKKLLFIAALINFCACKDSGTEKSKTQAAKTDTAKAVSPNAWTDVCDCEHSTAWEQETGMDALAYINNFQKLKKKTKSGKDINAVWVSYDPCALSCLMRAEGILNVKFFIAAYNAEVLPRKYKNYPTIIIQIKWKVGYPKNIKLGKAVTLDDQYLYYAASAYCPPPDPPCNIQFDSL